MRRLGIMTANDKENIVSCVKILSKYFDSEKYFEPASHRLAVDEYLNAWHLLKDTLTNMAAEEKADDYDIDEGDIVVDDDEEDNNEENYRDCMTCIYDKKKFTEEPCASCDSYGSNFEEKTCKTCKYLHRGMYEEPCYDCAVNLSNNTYTHDNYEPIEDEKTCENCVHMNEIPFGGPCEDCENGHLDGWEPIENEKENNTMNNQMKITSPWITYVNQVKCLFADDTDVLVEYNDDKKSLVLKVFDSHRADALTQLLPTERNFGGVTLHISVVPANKEAPSFAELVEKAMDGNPHFSQLIKVPVQDGKSFNYLMFEPEVAQYWNDNLADPNGNVSTTYADLAQDVFGVVPGTFFATDC